MLDKYGYPTEKTLEKISNWNILEENAVSSLIEYIKENYWHPDYLITKNKNILRISTGGWSGNESIIFALKANKIFWLMHWKSSHRGGYYEFEIRH